MWIDHLLRHALFPHKQLYRVVGIWPLPRGFWHNFWFLENNLICMISINCFMSVLKPKGLKSCWVVSSFVCCQMSLIWGTEQASHCAANVPHLPVIQNGIDTRVHESQGLCNIPQNVLGYVEILSKDETNSSKSAQGIKDKKQNDNIQNGGCRFPSSWGWPEHFSL